MPFDSPLQDYYQPTCAFSICVFQNILAVQLNFQQIQNAISFPETEKHIEKCGTAGKQWTNRDWWFCGGITSKIPAFRSLAPQRPGLAAYFHKAAYVIPATFFGRIFSSIIFGIFSLLERQMNAGQEIWYEGRSSKVRFFYYAEFNFRFTILWGTWRLAWMWVQKSAKFLNVFWKLNLHFFHMC